jgi:hypothetical protein
MKFSCDTVYSNSEDRIGATSRSWDYSEEVCLTERIIVLHLLILYCAVIRCVS